MVLGCPASETEAPQGLGRNRTWLCQCWDPWAGLGESQTWPCFQQKEGTVAPPGTRGQGLSCGRHVHLMYYCTVVPSPPHGSGFHHHQDICSILPCCSPTLLCTKPHGTSWAGTLRHCLLESVFIPLLAWSCFPIQIQCWQRSWRVTQVTDTPGSSGGTSGAGTPLSAGHPREAKRGRKGVWA